VIREPVGVSLAAQLGVLPVLLVAFGSMPAVTPIANLLAAPAAEALGVYGMVAAIVAGAVSPIGPVLHVPTRNLVGWVSLVARVAASVPLRIDARALLGIAAIGFAGASLACLRARRPVSEPAAR
jgi:hypothetical protein